MVELKQHDTARSITDVLKLGDQVIDLTDASVVLIIKGRNTPAVRRDATITNAAAGAVSYKPVAEDVENPGSFDLEWEITFQSGDVLSVPTHSYARLIINPDLG